MQRDAATHFGDDAEAVMHHHVPSSDTLHHHAFARPIVLRQFGRIRMHMGANCNLKSEIRLEFGGLESGGLESGGLECGSLQNSDN